LGSDREFGPDGDGLNVVAVIVEHQGESIRVGKPVRDDRPADIRERIGLRFVSTDQVGGFGVPKLEGGRDASRPVTPT
jgi:hypothetical protein